MIDWTDELVAQIGTYDRAALSYLGSDGYPVTLPLPFTFEVGEHLFRLPRPALSAAISMVAEGSHSLTLLRYDSQMANERYLLFYGHLAEQGDEWSFTPSQVVLQEWRSGRKG